MLSSSTGYAPDLFQLDRYLNSFRLDRLNWSPLLGINDRSERCFREKGGVLSNRLRPHLLIEHGERCDRCRLFHRSGSDWYRLKNSSLIGKDRLEITEVPQVGHWSLYWGR